ncbi:MAG: beta strand repeat-containing protein, partial [Gemmataceae bacterium]
VVTAQNIVIAADWTSTAGNLSFRANQQTTASSGNFIGIDVNDAQIKSTTGTISLVGRGGDDTVGGQVGIHLGSSTVTISTGGAVSLNGTGGKSSGANNVGVLFDSDTVTLSGGSISVVGIGGGIDTLGFNHGVVLAGEVDVTGAMTVQGTGGAANAADNWGVFVSGTVNSASAISLVGQGGGILAADSNFGIEVTGTITATGSASVSLLGTGGATTGTSNDGVSIVGGSVATNNGAISITGNGGGTALSSGGNVGVIVQGVVAAGGSGKVTVLGLGGLGAGSDNWGVFVGATGISSAGGDVSVTGTGGGSAGSDGNYGVVVEGSITAGGSGALDINGKGGAAGTFDYGVYIPGGIVSSAGGPVSITAEGGNGTSDALRLDTGATVSSGGTGTVTIVADSVNIVDAASTIKAGATGNAIATIRERTSGTKIDLGGANVLSGSPLTLGLTNAELARVFAGVLRIGDANAGAITVSSDIDVTANISTLHLTTGANVTATAAGITVNNLAVTAVSGANMTALTADVSRLAMAMSAGNATFTGDPTGFSVDTVDGVSGVVATGSVTLSTTGATSDLTIVVANTVTSSGSDVSLNAGRTIKVDGSISANGQVTLTSGGSTLLNGNVAANDDITMNAGGPITQAAGTVQTPDTITLNAVGQVATFNSLGNQAGVLVIPNGVTTYVNGSFNAAGLVQVAGTLGGTGSVGSVTVSGTGKVTPGSSPGKLSTSSVTFNTGSTFVVELNGTNPGTQYDQLAVTGSVDLGSATLQVSLGYAPAPGQVFKIIDNDTTSDAVTSTFNGYAEGSIVAVGPYHFSISYVGGDGNDVTLTALTPPTVTSLVLDNGVGGTLYGVDATVQRSEVRRLIVTFSSPVTFTGNVADAFKLHRNQANSISTGPNVDVTLVANPVTGTTNSVTITFANPLAGSIADAVDDTLSLVNGYYDLTIDASKVVGTGGGLNGSGAAPGTNYQQTGTLANKFFRAFGDATGDGSIDQNDYLLFRNTISSGPNPNFDFQNSGDVDQEDYLAFRQSISQAP